MLSSNDDSAMIEVTLFLTERSAKFIQSDSFKCQLVEEWTATDIGVLQYRTVSAQTSW